MRLAFVVVALAGCALQHGRDEPEEVVVNVGVSSPSGVVPAPEVPPVCGSEGWIVEVVDSDAERYGDVAIAVDAEGVLHVAYTTSGSQLSYARRDESGWEHSVVADRVPARSDGRTVELVATRGGPTVFFFGYGPDSSAHALFHATRRVDGWSPELVTPWGQMFNRLPRPHLTTHLLGDESVATVFRGLVDHLTWALFDGGAWELDVEDVHANTEQLATATDLDGTRAHAFHRVEHVYAEGRLVETLEQLDVRWGERKQVYGLERRDPGPLPYDCPTRGIDVVPRGDTLDIVFASAERTFIGWQCGIAHYSIRADDWDSWSLFSGGSSTLDAVADGDGLLHVATSDSESARYAFGSRAEWRRETLPIGPAEELRIDQRSGMVAIAAILQSSNAVVVAHRRDCD